MNNSPEKRLKITPPYLAGLAVILAGLVVRFLWLGADPPLYFTDTSQSLLTDPYNVTYFARNKALFGSWDIFDFDRWIVFKYSLSSAFSYLFFLLGGVSRITANLAATFLSLGGIILFILAHRKTSRISFLTVSVLLLSNMLLLVFGRYPFLESGLIFLCGLLYFLFNEFYPGSWILLFSGVLLSLCILSGKMFGAVMLVPIGAVVLADNQKEFPRRLGLVVTSFIVSMVLLSLLFYGSKINVPYSYLTEQTTGMYGMPDALGSPVRFIEKLFTFGGRSKLFYFSPFLLVMLFVSTSELILSRDVMTKLRDNRLLTFNLTWLIAGILLLMIFNYRPLRYQVFLILPASGIIACILSGYNKGAPSRSGFIRLTLLFLTCWYFTTQVGIILTTYLSGIYPTYRMVWYGVFPAVVLGLILYAARSGFLRLLNHKHYALIPLLILSVVLQFHWIYRWSDHKSYCLKQAGEDLDRTVDDGAVIIGPYSSAMTIDNALKSFVYMFGLSKEEPDLFHRFPVTHLAIDLSNWREAVKDYPELENSFKVSEYWIRDVEISIIRINDEEFGRENIFYNPTEYEKAMSFHWVSQFPDSIFHYLTRFLNANPESKVGLKILGGYYLATGAVNRGLGMYDKLISLYPDDFSMYFEKARAYYILHLMNRNQELLGEADRYFELARSVNPYIEQDIVEAKKHVDSLSR